MLLMQRCKSSHKVKAVHLAEVIARPAPPAAIELKTGIGSRQQSDGPYDAKGGVAIALLQPEAEGGGQQRNTEQQQHCSGEAGLAGYVSASEQDEQALL